MTALIAKYMYAAIAVALLALCAGSYWAGHHKGYASGEEAGNKRADAALVAQHKAEADTATLAGTLQEVNVQTAKIKADADAAAQRAAKATAAADAVKRQADRDAAAYLKQLDAAKAKPGCEVLKERLCSAALNY